MDCMHLFYHYYLELVSLGFVLDASNPLVELVHNFLLPLQKGALRVLLSFQQSLLNIHLHHHQEEPIKITRSTLTATTCVHTRGVFQVAGSVKTF